LLSEGKTDLLTNFKSLRTGRGFKAYLARQADGKIGFEFEAPAKKRAGSKAEVKSSDKPSPAKRAPAKKRSSKKLSDATLLPDVQNTSGRREPTT